MITVVVASITLVKHSLAGKDTACSVKIPNQWLRNYGMRFQEPPFPPPPRAVIMARQKA